MSLPVTFTTVSLMYAVLPDLGSITTLSSAHLATFAGEAEAEINANIAQKYALPISQDVPMLTTLATDLAIYNTLAKRVFTAERLAGSPWTDRYKEAQTKLQRLAEGDLLLVTSSGTVIAGRTDIAEVFSTTKNYLPTMHEGPWPYQQQDVDKIQDTLDDRNFDNIRDRLN